MLFTPVKPAFSTFALVAGVTAQLPELSSDASAASAAYDACKAMSASLPGQVAYPDSAEYSTSTRYWSQRQSDLHPRCYVLPSKAQDVSLIIQYFVANDVTFTVKSGGHATFGGASSISANGVVIDLRNLNIITVTEDRKTVTVGAGLRWKNVTHVLDSIGLAIVGGRVSDPGVGGLTLGGGISYFSGTHGFVCDNVQQYEIVIPSGQVVYANASNNADLFWALRGGGGSNFGVVTRFDYAPFEHSGILWAQSNIFAGALNTTLVPLMQQLAASSEKGLPADPPAHTYFTMMRIPGYGDVAYMDQFHTAPPQTSDAAAFLPEIFKPFNDIPAYMRQARFSNLTTLLDGIALQYGLRQHWMNHVIKATSAEMMQTAVDLYQAHTQRLDALAKGRQFSPFMTFQPLPVNVLSAMQKNGGNALGLKPEDGPLIMVQCLTTWTDLDFEQDIIDSTKVFFWDLVNKAQDKGLDRGFVYMNYAEHDQDVFDGYGDDNYQRLRDVARKYDPDGALQRLWRGYFSLFRGHHA